MGAANSKKLTDKLYQWNDKELIDDGKVCHVYKCIRKGSKKEPSMTVALKVLKNPTLSKEEINQFVHAYSFAEYLTHRNINKVHGLVHIDGYNALVMDYADLGNLAKFKFKDQAQKIQSALDMVSGLKFLHEKNAFHRNLKPSNVLLKTGEEDGSIITQIADVGLGKVMFSASGNTQFTDEPEYRAPELIKGNEYDLRVDVYSLSIILYEMFTGQKYALPKHKKSVANILDAIQSQVKPDMTTLGADMTPLVLLIGKGWSFDPSERPTLEEFQNGLETIRLAFQK